MEPLHKKSAPLQRDPLAEAELLAEQESWADRGQLRIIRDQEWLFLTLDGPNFKEPQQVQFHLTAGYIMPYPMDEADVELSLRDAARKGEYPPGRCHYECSPDGKLVLDPDVENGFAIIWTTISTSNRAWPPLS